MCVGEVTQEDEVRPQWIIEQPLKETIRGRRREERGQINEIWMCLLNSCHGGLLIQDEGWEKHTAQALTTPPRPQPSSDAAPISIQLPAITITRTNYHHRTLRRHFHPHHCRPFIYIIASIAPRQEIEVGPINKYNIKLNWLPRWGENVKMSVCRRREK